MSDSANGSRLAPGSATACGSSSTSSRARDPSSIVRSTSRARRSTVGASMIHSSGASTLNAVRNRAITCVARSECPPRAKKSSSTPTCPTASTCANARAIQSSVGERGAVYGVWLGSVPRSWRRSASMSIRSSSTSSVPICQRLIVTLLVVRRRSARPQTSSPSPLHPRWRRTRKESERGPRLRWRFRTDCQRTPENLAPACSLDSE